MAQSEIIEIVRNYGHLLVSMGINIEKVFLYGSWARNDATESSDIDVMLVSSAFEQADDKLKARTWRATEKIDLRIEPFMVTLKKFMNDDVSPLLQIVKKEGVEIVL
jgi:predicted nucleotidyltransferase